ncbi:MAG TPA: DUF2304 domain-containing protein [Solirubrobacteraceae bacterium]|jgi:hypothetical protein
MHLGAQLASIAFAAVVFLVVLEMVRRRYLRERYAILWLGAALVLLVLAAWTQLLSTISSAVGIATPSNAFFVIAFAFLLLLLLHFSAVVSRLADETRVLAQRLALLEERERADHRSGADYNDDETENEEYALPGERLAAGRRRQPGPSDPALIRRR